MPLWRLNRVYKIQNYGLVKRNRLLQTDNNDATFKSLRHFYTKKKKIKKKNTTRPGGFWKSTLTRQPFRTMTVSTQPTIFSKKQDTALWCISQLFGGGGSLFLTLTASRCCWFHPKDIPVMCQFYKTGGFIRDTLGKRMSPIKAAHV